MPRVRPFGLLICLLAFGVACGPDVLESEDYVTDDVALRISNPPLCEPGDTWKGCDFLRAFVEHPEWEQWTHAELDSQCGLAPFSATRDRKALVYFTLNGPAHVRDCRGGALSTCKTVANWESNETTWVVECHP
jgi:hypothetical protein